MVLTEGDATAAWLIVVSRPARPVSPLVPAPARHEASDVLTAALKTAAGMLGEFGGPGLMRNALLGKPKVGLRRWVEGNFLQPFQGERPSGRLLLVELHQDGTVVYAVDVSRSVFKKQTGPNPVSVVPYVPVEARAVQVGMSEAVALSHEFRLARRIDSSTDLTSLIICRTEAHEYGGQPFAGFAPVLEQYGFMEVPSAARCPSQFLPWEYVLPPAADLRALRDCAQSLSAGVLHQLGVESVIN
ncbi:hypothetical protein ACH4UV_38440 [Streptomyces sp. NPDC020802]|uniref:hypothetical protein n=1 Tax=Streptomyces sp. NPDC020802 TaxID=3365094 RepID=UPI0037A24275